MFSDIQLAFITGLTSFLFTLFILSYLFGDNPVFQFAIHAFLGVSAGYIGVIIIQQVIYNKLLFPLVTGTFQTRLILVFPLVMSLMLLAKTSSSLEWLRRPVMALMVGVGAATIVAGAVIGTIFPQVLAAIGMFGLKDGVSNPQYAGSLVMGGITLLGTIVTLGYFQFQRGDQSKTPGSLNQIFGFIALLGQIFIAVTLGAIFAGVLLTVLTALSERVVSSLSFLESLFSFIH